MDKEAGVLIMFYFIVNPKARSAQGGMLWDKVSEILTGRNLILQNIPDMPQSLPGRFLFSPSHVLWLWLEETEP